MITETKPAVLEPFPPWASIWKTSGTWNPEVRHEWLAKALLLRRVTQAVQHDRANTALHYMAMLKAVIGNLDFADGDQALEIISDGMAEHEPFWDGLLIDSAGATPLATDSRAQYAKQVAENRIDITGEYRTHLDIAKTLFEPVLFRIASSEVSWFHQGRWVAIDADETTLPLKLEHAPTVLYDGNLAEVKKSVQLVRRTERYLTIIAAMKHALLTLSTKVLWPALFGSRRGEKLSLVLMQASLWQVPGVWALHLLATNGRHSTATAGHAEQAVAQIVAPPVGCLNDVAGAAFFRDGSWREEDLLLFRRSFGRTERLGDDPHGASLDADESAIYRRAFSTDPFARYAELFERAIVRNRSGLDGLSASGDDDDGNFDRALARSRADREALRVIGGSVLSQLCDAIEIAYVMLNGTNAASRLRPILGAELRRLVADVGVECSECLTWRKGSPPDIDTGTVVRAMVRLVSHVLRSQPEALRRRCDWLVAATKTLLLAFGTESAADAHDNRVDEHLQVLETWFDRPSSELREVSDTLRRPR